MAANESTKFTHFSNVEIGTANGGGRLVVGGVEQNLGAPESVSAALSPAAADSGKTYILNGGTGVAITLPAPASGLSYKFIVGAAFTTDYVITATGAIMYGVVEEAGAVQAVAGATTLTLEDGAEAVGDYLELLSDGTNWYVSGQFATALSITPA